MPKNSKEKVENDKKKILRELQRNSKTSLADIAKKLGFSYQKIRRIVKDFEDSNIIWGYTSIIDDNKIGRKRYFILLKRSHKPVTEEGINTVIERDLKKVASKLGVELESSYYIYGIYDWLICVTATDIKQVKMFCDSFSNVFKGSYISELQILEVLFPVERNGFDNPNKKDLISFFKV